MGRPTSWSAEMISFIQELWLRNGEQEMSVKRIAEAFNARFDKTLGKSAIGGKINRMRKIVPDQWPARGSPLLLGGPKKLPATKPVIDFRQPMPTIARPFVDHPPPKLPATPMKPVVQNQIRREDGSGCRFPMWGNEKPTFKFCDNPLLSFFSPYCAEHHKTCYVRRDAPRESESTHAILPM